MDAIRFQKNTLTEKIESIDYTHLLGYPSEVVAVEIITMVKDIIWSEVNTKETNMEHFRGEIEAIMKDFEGFGVDIDNSKLIVCKSGNCDRCKFSYLNNKNSEDPCGKHKIKWLMSEYKPEPVLTQREKGFVECIRHGWIAADEVGSRMWYEDKPKKDKEPNVWLGKKIVTLNDDYFSFITWEDEEPWSVADLRKLKVGGCDER